MNRRSDCAWLVRPNGFTIIEAVVLISIVGIIGAVAAPRFLAMSEMDAARAQRQALADLRFAQRLSMNSGCPVQVDFSVGGYTLTNRLACRAGAFSSPIVDPVANRAPYTVVLPTGVSLTSTVDPLVFDALGRTTTTSGLVSNATITIGGRALESIGETGLVRVP
jgi:MSHA pilin protein MshC